MRSTGKSSRRLFSRVESFEFRASLQSRRLQQEECIFTNSSTDNRNSFNNLTSELLVLRLIELVEETNKETECFLEVGNEGFFGLLNRWRECCSCIFFNERYSILNEKAQLLTNDLKVW